MQVPGFKSFSPCTSKGPLGKLHFAQRRYKRFTSLETPERFVTTPWMFTSLFK